MFDFHLKFFLIKKFCRLNKAISTLSVEVFILNVINCDEMQKKVNFCHTNL